MEGGGGGGCSRNLQQANLSVFMVDNVLSLFGIICWNRTVERVLTQTGCSKSELNDRYGHIN